MSQLLSRVGPVSGADGSSPALRAGKEAELIVSQAHGKYAEASRRGRMFSVGAGTVTPGTTVGTAAAFALYNPPSSGKRLSIKKVSVAYQSGTLGAGAIFHVVNPVTTQAAPSAGTALTPFNCSVGSSVGAVGQARVNATVGAGVLTGRPWASTGAELATTPNGIQTGTDDVDGEITVEPGCSYQLQALATAGTAPLIAVGVTWEELDAG